MAERDSWAVGATADRKVGTEDARLAVGALLTQANTNINTRVGLRPGPQSPGLVQATGTPGPTVTVNAFQGFPSLAARQGAYIATLDDTKTIDVLGANPADPSNQRNDLIVAQQNDADYGDANRNFQVIRITGTPSGTPADPAVPGSQNYITLARIRVTAGATTITNAMIDDLRPGWVVALGAILPIADVTARNALTGTRYDGFVIYRQDRDWIEVYDGTAWRVQGVAICTSTADRDGASGVTNPVNGQLAVTTDTGFVWQRHAGAWRLLTPSETIARCTADTTRNNSTTLLNVTGLSVALDANAIYTFHGYLAYSSGATPDIKFAWTVPSGATGHWALWPTVQSAAGTVGDVSSFWDNSFTTAQGAGGSDTLSGSCSCLPQGYIATTNAGTMQLQFAQVNATASDTIVRVGAWVRFNRIA